MKRNDFIVGFTLALSAVLIVFLTEQIIQPAYLIKSAVKLGCFLGAIGFYCLLTKKNLKEVLCLRKIKNPRPLLLAIICFFLGVSLAFLLSENFIDLAGIKASLISKEQLSRDNCLYVFAYIIIVNSFLEESFFRGFLSGIFKDKRKGAIFASLLFSLYHIGIFISWFNPLIFALCLIGLFLVGIFLEVLLKRHDSLFATYIVHASANIAINIIGTLLIFELI